MRRAPGHAAWPSLAIVCGVAVGAAAGLATAAPLPSPATREAAVATPDGARGPSPLIYPPGTVTIQFDHRKHAARGASCDSCHAAAAGSTSVADNLIPPESACAGCHAIDRALPAKAATIGQPPARCDACHADGAGAGWMPGGPLAEPPRGWLPRANLKFNHRLHATQGIACAVCHARAGAEATITRADLPLMATCLGCHDGKQATARCGACHLTEPDGRLIVKLAGAALLQPSGSLRGLDAHGPTFRRDHAQAGRDESYCLSCHRRNECVDCHGGVVRPPDIHPSDYISLHPADARRNTPDCSTCHREQTFCLGCHQRSGVAPDPTGGVPGQKVENPFGTGTKLKQFHPPGWARDAAGAVIATPRPTSHSVQAKRNIRECASCHREDSCLTCHSATQSQGAAVSPHGPGFRATARCRFLAARNRRVCLKCHALGAAEIDCE